MLSMFQSCSNLQRLVLILLMWVTVFILVACDSNTTLPTRAAVAMKARSYSIEVAAAF
jgi:hypothetical protein